MRIYKLRIPEAGGNKWCAFSANARDGLMAEIELLEIGDHLEIEACEMTQEEVDALPEFEGW
jgi:hypothetical protein